MAPSARSSHAGRVGSHQRTLVHLRADPSLMLVLTREPGEAIHIGDGVVITLIEVDAKSCRIGIQVPPSGPVYRAKVYARSQAENKRAAATQQPAPQAMAQLFRKRKEKSS